MKKRTLIASLFLALFVSSVMILLKKKLVSPEEKIKSLEILFSEGFGLSFRAEKIIREKDGMEGLSAVTISDGKRNIFKCESIYFRRAIISSRPAQRLSVIKPVIKYEFIEALVAPQKPPDTKALLPLLINEAEIVDGNIDFVRAKISGLNAKMTVAGLFERLEIKITGNASGIPAEYLGAKKAGFDAELSAVLSSGDILLRKLKVSAGKNYLSLKGEYFTQPVEGEKTFTGLLALSGVSIPGWPDKNGTTVIDGNFSVKYPLEKGGEAVSAEGRNIKLKARGWPEIISDIYITASRKTGVRGKLISVRPVRAEKISGFLFAGEKRKPELKGDVNISSEFEVSSSTKNIVTRSSIAAGEISGYGILDSLAGITGRPELSGFSFVSTGTVSYYPVSGLAYLSDFIIRSGSFTFILEGSLLPKNTDLKIRLFTKKGFWSGRYDTAAGPVLLNKLSNYEHIVKDEFILRGDAGNPNIELKLSPELQQAVLERALKKGADALQEMFKKK